MKCDPEEVKKELRRRILQGGDPYYSFESVCDNGGVDWTVLSEGECEENRSTAFAERARSRAGRNEAAPLWP